MHERKDIHASVEIFTNKISYRQGEIVRVTVENHLDTQIRLHESIERNVSDAWESIGPRESHVILPSGMRFEMLPHTHVDWEWDAKDPVVGALTGQYVAPGTYRVLVWYDRDDGGVRGSAYSDAFEIRP